MRVKIGDSLLNKFITIEKVKKVEFGITHFYIYDSVDHKTYLNKRYSIDKIEEEE